MPIIKSAKKRMRQNVRRNADNRMRRSTLRTSIRRLHEVIAGGDRDAIQAQWIKTQGLLDRTARLGIIHRNAAARTKSRLARRVGQVAAG
jgi:small subunit ribosomal protein S20